MRELKNKEKGKNIFILAGGPSTLDLDLSLLKNEIVIGMNGTILLEKDFSSKYYVISDSRFINKAEKFELIKESLYNYEKEFIFRKDITQFIPNKENYNIKKVKCLGRDGFSFNILNGFFHGTTTCMLAIQTAFFLGASKIFLLGVDLNYVKNKIRSYEKISSEIPDSFLSYQIRNIVNASIELKKKNIDLINLSKDSFLKPYLKFNTYENSLSNKEELTNQD